jgi:flagellar basal body-associated protein FliL
VAREAVTRSRGFIAAAVVAALVAVGIGAALVLGGRSSDDADADHARTTSPATTTVFASRPPIQ